MKAVFVGGKLNKTVMEVEEVLELQLLECRGYSKDHTKEREQGLCVPRKELDNQPLFEGYLGPMWDGDMLRYETQEVYNMLSM